MLYKLCRHSLEQSLRLILILPLEGSKSLSYNGLNVLLSLDSELAQGGGCFSQEVYLRTKKLMLIGASVFEKSVFDVLENIYFVRLVLTGYIGHIVN